MSAGVTTWLLEMLNREQLRPASAPALGAHVARVPHDWRLSRWFYTEVGRSWPGRRTGEHKIVPYLKATV